MQVPGRFAAMLSLPAVVLLRLFAVAAILTAATAHACIIVPPDAPPRPQPTTEYLECRSQHVTISIEHPVARVKIETVLYNPHSRPVEGTFIFPLPPGAAVTKFQFAVGGKPVTGEILPAEKAREIYLSFIRRTRDPALLEYADFGMFKASIFPVPPGKTEEITSEYLMTLRPDNNLVRFFHNLKLGRNETTENARLVVEGRIHSALALTTVFSPSHDLDVHREGQHTAKFSLELDKRPFDRDFVLCYGVAEAELGLHWLAHREAGEDGYVLLALAPTVGDGQSTPPKDIVLVLDTSGSMSGEKLQQAQSALKYALKTLGPQDRFSLIAFATTVRKLDDKLLAASPDNIQRAQRFVEEMEAVGGTALNDALVEACKVFVDEGERPRYVLFVTDGRPTVGEREEARILKNVAAAREAVRGRPPRLFLLGVGYDVNTRLLDTLAQQGGGTSGYVRPEEDLEVALSSLVSKIGHPALTDVKLRVEGRQVLDLQPAVVPDLFRGDQVLAVGRYLEPGEARVELSGRLEGREEKRWTWPLPLPDQERGNDFLPRLWATRQVAYLLDQIRLHGEDEELKKEVVRLALKFGIVTPYTSYLVTEEEPRLAEEAARRPAWRAAMGPGAGGGGAFGVAAPAAQAAREGLAGAPVGQAAVDAAKDLQALRAAPTVSAVEGPAQVIRSIAGKVFYLDADAGYWVDSEFTTGEPQACLRYLGDAYLALVGRRPDIARWLAVGEKVKLRVGTLQLVIAPDVEDELTKEQRDGLGL
ncbi:MAG: VIT and VWA domain-containing protein [Armatimonadetes bacterium]|nr:VIT and VWA domain-containing protein [Armatimonadota bacterium]